MGLSQRSFQRTIALTIHTSMVDPEMTRAQQEKAASAARRIADVLKRSDPTFSYEWFFGACGLDAWGDVIAAG